MTGRLLAQLAEVALRDAAAELDPRHTPDEVEGAAPTRVIGFSEIQESRRLTRIAGECQLRAALAGFSACDDPFESEEENERRRCKEWEHIFP